MRNTRKNGYVSTPPRLFNVNVADFFPLVNFADLECTFESTQTIVVTDIVCVRKLKQKSSFTNNDGITAFEAR